MPYSLRKIYKELEREVVELNRLISLLALQQESIERDTHIEGCYIRLVVSWESFSEEYFLRCMCKAQLRSGNEIRPMSAASRNLEDAFKKLSKHHRQRDKDFMDWLEPSELTKRTNIYFRKNSRVQMLCESPDKLFALQTIRNAIAHRSKFAQTKFENYVKDQLGYLKPLNPTAAALLVQKKRFSQEYIFNILSNYFLSLAEKLTR